MVANVLTACVTKPSAYTLLNIYDKYDHVIHAEKKILTVLLDTILSITITVEPCSVFVGRRDGIYLVHGILVLTPR